MDRRFCRMLMGLPLLLATGCGAAEAPASAPSTKAPDDLSSVQAEFDRAEQEVRLALGESEAQPPPPPPAAPPAAGAPGPTPPARAVPQAAPTQGGPAASATGAEANTGGCGMACRALASMERAAQHLCGLAGESDARCESARARLRTASERVKVGCPACPPA